MMRTQQVQFGAVYRFDKGVPGAVQKATGSSKAFTEAITGKLQENDIAAKAVSIKDYRKSASFWQRLDYLFMKEDQYLILTGRDLDPTAPRSTTETEKKELTVIGRFITDKYQEILHEYGENLRQQREILQSMLEILRPKEPPKQLPLPGFEELLSEKVKPDKR